jgi:uncharacterized protein (TIGR03086 family)
MTDWETIASPANASGLLECAVGYALGEVQAVTPHLLLSPTPCTQWDLSKLLCHLNDSFDVLAEAINAGRIGLYPAGDGDVCGGTDQASLFCSRARMFLNGSTDSDPGPKVSIAGHSLATDVVTAVVAIEVAVHGWDVSQATGLAEPIPTALAIGLLEICPLLVTDATRHPAFAEPINVSPQASPSDRLVAYLGRKHHPGSALGRPRRHRSHPPHRGEVPRECGP